jgi:hypothetical protein
MSELSQQIDRVVSASTRNNKIYPCAFMIFGIEDALSYAKDEMHERITIAEAEEVIKTVDDHIDCENGLSWLNIEEGIRQVIRERKS